MYTENVGHTAVTFGRLQSYISELWGSARSECELQLGFPTLRYDPQIIEIGQAEHILGIRWLVPEC